MEIIIIGIKLIADKVSNERNVKVDIRPIKTYR